MKYIIEPIDLKAIQELIESGIKIDWSEDNNGEISIYIDADIAFDVGKACGLRQAETEFKRVLKSYKTY